MTLFSITSYDVPPLLREIPDAPEKLYLRGAEPPTTDSHKYLAVVGSRSYTPYGKQVCERLIKGLAGYPVVVVSGLALGIDGIAHTAALDTALPTIAVPGSGLGDKVLYPATHRALAMRIMESGGALVSEYERDVRAQAYMFPKRNRIMAGMSHAVLVIEAESKSGTLITSRLATEYNRDVCTVPGPIYQPTSEGPHMLIKRGAALIVDSDDILEVLGIQAQDAKRVSSPQLSLDDARVVELLRSPMPRDQLIAALDIPTTQANVLLSSLELRGLIQERMGVLEIV